MTSIVVSQRPSLASGTSVNPGGSATGPSAIQATTPGASGAMLLTSPVIGGAGSYNPPSFSVTGTRPVPMKLFATWEVDRTPPNCIPRLCSLTVTRLVVFKSLGSGSVVVAVKMEGSKRTLRSNEILIPPHPDPHNGGRILDTELELTFSLQYPHFVKRGGNRLHVMLQRRKRYKNRAILVGFKTLAVGSVDMSQVLQKQLDLELELYGSDSKNAAANTSGTGAPPTDVVVGKVSVFSLSSQPVDGAGATGNGRQKGRLGDGEDDRTETCSEDEDDDYTSPDSDSADDTPRRKSRVPSASDRGAERGPNSGKSARQQNLKQKFMALMKKFKVEGIGRAEQVELDRELSEAAVDPADIDYLFDQLEEEEDDDDLSDSGPDTISVGSTPKPSLKPFFCSSRSDLNEARISVPISGSGGGPVSRTVSGVKSDDHANVDQTTGERHSDDSSKEAVAGGAEAHPDNLTDDQENEMSDPPIVATTTTTTNTTASSGDDEARRERSSKKADRPFTVMKQQQLAQQQLQPQQQQQQQKVLKDRASNDQLLRNTQLQQQQSHPGLDVSSSSATRKGLLEQLGRVLPNDVDSLPDKVFLANTSDHYGARLAEKLSDNGGFKVVCAANPAEVRASLSCLVVKIQKFCNTQTWESPPLVKVALIGADDSFVSSALRAYVEVFSSKPPDWQSFVKFYIVPPVVTSGSGAASSSTSVAKYIAGKDELYASLFVHPTWRELLDGKDDDVHNEIVARVLKYLSAGDSSSPMQLPVAEAMVTYKEEKATGEESSQVFLPFLSDVRVGSDGPSGDSEDNFGASSSPSDRLTPPSSPRMIKERSDLSTNYDPVDLQLDYWAVVPSSSEGGNQSGSGSSKKYELSNSSSSQATKESKRPVETTGTKASIKASILHMQVQRLGDQTSGFTMHYWTAKEKKPKATVIRLGKKKMDPKEREVKSVEGITRLICLSKGHNTPLKVHIDGSEWSGVKFFQLSSQWQTHIKFFPVATLQPRPEAASASATH